MSTSTGVTVAIFKDDKVLLTLREDLPVWCLPGGRVEEGESVDRAAIREIREETGLDIRLLRLSGIYFRPQKEGGNHQVVFTAEATEGEPTPDGKETSKVEWYPLDRLPDRLFGVHRLYIQDAVRNGPAVVRSLNIYSTLSQYTRQELYAMRDQGKLDLRAVIAEICAPVETSCIQDGLDLP